MSSPSPSNDGIRRNLLERFDHCVIGSRRLWPRRVQRAKAFGMVLTLACSLMQGEAATQEWTQFRGPNAQGVVETADPPVEFGPQTNLVWKVEIPPGHSSPVVSSGKIFLTSFTDRHLWTHGYDLETGRELWRQRCPAENFAEVHEYNNLAASTLVTDGHRVILYSGDYGVLAYDSMGSELWRHPLPFVTNRWGTASSPILAEDRLVIAHFGLGTGSALVAIEPQTGATLWETRKELPSMNQSTPVVWFKDGRRQIVVFGAGQLMGFDFENGKELWSVGGFPRMVTLTPASAGNRIYVGAAGVLGNSSPNLPTPSWSELLQKYDRDGDGRLRLDEFPPDFEFLQRPDLPRGTSGRGGFVTDWLGKDPKALDAFFDAKKYQDMIKSADSWSLPKFAAIEPDGGGELSTNAVRWTLNRGVPEVPSPLYYRERLYLVRNGGLLKCLDPVTGRQVYDERLGAGGQYIASPIAAGGRIYCCSDAGVISAIAAGDQLSTLSRVDLAEQLTATPALIGNRLCVRTASHLWLFAGSTVSASR